MNKKGIYIILLIFLMLLSCSIDFDGTAITNNNQSIGNNQPEKKPEFLEEVTAPAHITATQGEMDFIAVSWTSVYGAVSYTVYRADEETGSYNVIAEKYSVLPDPVTQEIVFTDDGTYSTLTSSQNYFYKVSAVGKDDIQSKTSLSAVGFCYSSSAPIAPPQVVSATFGDFSNEIRLTWNKVGNACMYFVLRAESEEGVFETIASTETTSFYDTTEIASNKSYFYQIQAQDIFGIKSIPSSVVEGKSANDTIPSIFTNFNASQGTSQNTVELSWDSLNGASGYKIYRSCEENGVFTQIGEVPSSQNTYTDDSNAILFEKPFFYKIKVTTPSGDGPLSSNTATGFITIDSPTLTLTGANPLIINLSAGELYSDLGATAYDNLDGNISHLVYVDDTAVDATTRGDYTVTYSVQDKAGNETIVTRTVSVKAMIDTTNGAVALSGYANGYPIASETVLITASGFTADLSGGNLLYSYAVNGTNVGSNDTGVLSRAYFAGHHTLTLTVSNADDSIQVTKPFTIYPSVIGITNGNFEAPQTASVAPWLWDVDYYWDIDDMLRAGWATTNIQDTPNDYFDREQIVSVADSKGIGGSRAAVFGDLSVDTQVWASKADIEQSAGKLYYNGINLVAGWQYKVTAYIYRGVNSSTTVTVSLTGADSSLTGTKSVAMGTTKGTWIPVELTVTATANCTARLEIFKGNSWTDGDNGELRIDNVSIAYNN